METLRVEKLEKLTSNKGAMYLKLTQPDDSVVFAWDAKTFGALEQAPVGSDVICDLDRSGKYPRITSVKEVRAAPANGSRPASSAAIDAVLNRDRSIRRQVALKCAIEAAGSLPSSALGDIEVYVRVVRRLADDLVEWLEEETDIPF